MAAEESKGGGTAPATAKSSAKAGGGPVKQGSFLDMLEAKNAKPVVPFDGSLFKAHAWAAEALSENVRKFTVEKLLGMNAFEALMEAMLEFEDFVVEAYTAPDGASRRPLLLEWDPYVQELRDKACFALQDVPRTVATYTIKSKTAGAMFRDYATALQDIRDDAEAYLSKLSAFEDNTKRAGEFADATGREAWRTEAGIWIQEQTHKADIGVQLEGSVPLETMWRLQNAGLLDTDYESQEAMERAIVLDATDPVRRSTRAGVDGVYSIYQQAFRHPTATRQITRDVIKSAFVDGVHLMELRFTPHLMCYEESEANDTRARPYPVEWDEHMEAIMAGRKLALDFAPGMVVGLVVCASRTFGAASVDATATFAQRWRPQLCGFSLCGEEETYPALTFVPAMKRVHKLKLPLSVTCGEGTSAKLVANYVEALRPVKRVVHGVAIVEDEGLMRRMKNLGVVFELCPSAGVCSGVVPSLAEHPIVKMLRAGLKVTVATDRPALFGTSLGREWLHCMTLMQLDKKDMLAMCRVGVAASFVTQCPAHAHESTQCCRTVYKALEGAIRELDAWAGSAGVAARAHAARAAKSVGQGDESKELTSHRARMAAATRVERHPESAAGDIQTTLEAEARAMEAVSKAARLAAEARKKGELVEAAAAEEAALKAARMATTVAGATPKDAQLIAAKAASVAAGAQAAGYAGALSKLKAAREALAQATKDVHDWGQAIIDRKADEKFKIAAANTAKDNDDRAKHELLEAHLAKKAEKQSEQQETAAKLTEAMNARSAASAAIVHAREEEYAARKRVAEGERMVEQRRDEAISAGLYALEAGVDVDERPLRLAEGVTLAKLKAEQEAEAKAEAAGDGDGGGGGGASASGAEG